MEVETENKAWDPRWFVVRDTCLCIHESDTHTEPTAVFPCAVRRFDSDTDLNRNILLTHGYGAAGV